MGAYNARCTKLDTHFFVVGAKRTTWEKEGTPYSETAGVESFDERKVRLKPRSSEA